MELPRCAVFVDAGYLISGAGYLYLGAARRAEVACDYATSPPPT